MKLNLQWAKPISLKDGSKQNLIYTIDQNKLPQASGVYIFGRRFGNSIEALYVGQALNIHSRVKGQLNNLALMKAVQNSSIGKRVVITGQFMAGPGQQPKKCLSLIERSLIRNFLSSGHDLVNKQGTHLRRHEIISLSKLPKTFIPTSMFMDA